MLSVKQMDKKAAMLKLSIGVVQGFGGLLKFLRDPSRAISKGHPPHFRPYITTAPHFRPSVREEEVPSGDG